MSSFLHQPTLRQLNSGGHDWRKLGSRCDELVVKLDAVLASPVFNINFGTFTTFNCMNEDCAKTVRKRLPRGQTEVPAVCFECGAEHVVQVESTGTHTVRPVVQDVSCANPECGHGLKLFRYEIRAGAYWECPECGTQCRIGLTVFADMPASQNEG